MLLPLVPWYPSQSSVPNRVQKVFTESVAQRALSRPETAHGLGETSNTMGDRRIIGIIGVRVKLMSKCNVIQMRERFIGVTHYS